MAKAFQKLQVDEALAAMMARKYDAFGKTRGNVTGKMIGVPYNKGDLNR